MPVFEHATCLPVPASAAYRWHMNPGAFERFVPPWENIRVTQSDGPICEGSEVIFEIRKGPVRRKWKAVHRDFQEGLSFTDEQLSGPFAHWVHTHQFVPDGPERSMLRDHIEYRLPLHPLSSPVGGPFFARMIRKMFQYRSLRLERDLVRHQKFAARSPLRVAITGPSGLIGSNLSAFLRVGGHDAVHLVRRAPEPGSNEIMWTPGTGETDAQALSGIDAIVHLAGENLFSGRWNPRKKETILKSRSESTERLCKTLAKLERPPKVLVVASAIGYYGNCPGDDICREDHAAGTGFLSDVCKAWEEAAEPARAAGIRVVNARIGICVSRRAGVLKELLLPFTLGLGGRHGDGKQYMSWIGLDDVVGAIHHAILTDDLAGPVNLTAPNPVQNRDFARTLGAILKRPAILPLPGLALKAMLGEVGGLALEGARVEPAALNDGGFEYIHPKLEDAIRDELGLWQY